MTCISMKLTKTLIHRQGPKLNHEGQRAPFYLWDSMQDSKKIDQRLWAPPELAALMWILGDFDLRNTQLTNSSCRKEGTNRKGKKPARGSCPCQWKSTEHEKQAATSLYSCFGATLAPYFKTNKTDTSSQRSNLETNTERLTKRGEAQIVPTTEPPAFIFAGSSRSPQPTRPKNLPNLPIETIFPRRHRAILLPYRRTNTRSSRDISDPLCHRRPIRCFLINWFRLMSQNWTNKLQIKRKEHGKSSGEAPVRPSWPLSTPFTYTPCVASTATANDGAKDRREGTAEWSKTRRRRRN